MRNNYKTISSFLCVFIMSLFEMPIENLKYIGKKRGELYRKLSINTTGELIRYYPRAYDDLSDPTTIFSAIEGETCCIKVRISTVCTVATIKGGKFIASCYADDDTGSMRLVFFNNKFIKDKLKIDDEYYIYGKVSSGIGIKEMISPVMIHTYEGTGLYPIYNLTNGLTNNILRKNVADALKLLPATINDCIPTDYLEKYNLCGLKEALYNIHFPKSKEDIISARKRLVFEELLVLNLGLRSIKQKREKTTGYKITQSYCYEYINSLPYELTNAQKRAIEECINDMMQNKAPMSRLLQGDVGSGKTCVAAALCHTVIKNGYQCAIMAPTEILAQQHYDNLSKQLSNTDINIKLLTGSTTKRNKDIIKSELAAGDIDLIIGTHALLTDNVEFKALCLAVTDEQHRFGVAQRSKLLSKGKNPHCLVMSATPIPRTLALMIYGDLDISIIDEMPKGREKIDTFFINSNIRKRAYGFLKKHIDEGRQCYIVCPAVEENENDIISAEDYFEKVSKEDFKDYKVALLHGKMKARDKEKVMQDFVKGDIDLLISTTVVEVGVDVPNAVIMMVENAERFGLSQLHQLRGRVGRGENKSYCILVSDAKGEESLKRLEIMHRTNNGFEIADADLQMRGPGDFFGARQHGLPQLKIADLTDYATVAQTQKAADEICKEGLDLHKFFPLRAEINRLFSNMGERLN